MQPTETTHHASRHGTFYLDEGDLVARAEDTLYRFHSFHLQRATTHFDTSIQSLRNEVTQEGSHDERPLVLDGVKSSDFEQLLWFFYESAYRWSGIVDPALTERWESILLLAEKFGMKQAAKVACYALGRAGVLSGVHKIALCVKHGLGKDWVVDELKRTVSRDEPLTQEEGWDLGSDTTILLAAAREALRPQRKDSGVCTNKACKWGPHYSYNLAVTCSEGVHTCSYSGCRRTSICPARDRTTENCPSPDSEAIIGAMVLPEPEASAPISCAVVPDMLRNGDLFLQTEHEVFSVHSYHFKRASQAFQDMLNSPFTGNSNEGQTRDCPIVLDLRTHIRKC